MWKDLKKQGNYFEGGKTKEKGKERRKISVKKRASSPTQPLMEKTFRRKHIIIRFKKHMFGNHCKRARAKPEFDKKKFFKNWSNRDCSHKKVLPMKFVACANKLKFLKRNSPQTWVQQQCFSCRLQKRFFHHKTVWSRGPYLRYLTIFFEE